MHTERWGVWQIAVWRGVEDEAKLACVARMRGGGGPQAWTGVMELQAVTGGFLNVTSPEGNETMRKQIQEVLRGAGEDPSERGTAEEREDLKGVEVSSVQQLYVSVRGMTTSAATNKCEFSYTTPSGEELRWGPKRFTLYAEYHKRTLKPKMNSARTYHTVRGALTLNDPAGWCELCAWAHGKECEKLKAYRAEEAKQTSELMARARREAAPTRAQRQAARPEYTLDVEMEKQVRIIIASQTQNLRREGAGNAENGACLSHAGTGGKCAQVLRGGGEGSRRSEGRTQGRAQRRQNTDGLQGLQTSFGKLPVHEAKMQILSLQPSQARDASHSQRSRTGGGTEGEDASVAAERQGRRRKGSGIEPGWRMGRKRHRGSRGAWKRPRVDVKMGNSKGETRRRGSEPRNMLATKETENGSRKHNMTRVPYVPCERDSPIDCAIYCTTHAPCARNCPMDCAIHRTISSDKMTTHMKKAYEMHAGTKEPWILFLTWMIVTRLGHARFKRRAKNRKTGRKERSNVDMRETRKRQIRRIIQHRI
eukprot:2659422-Pleurochrysis_carterae.AAC.1